MMFVLTFGMLLGLMGLMSIGVVVSGKRLQGSCGGTGGACACDEAGRPRACEVEDPASGQLSAPHKAESGAMMASSDPESLATLPSRL